jgi:dTDP-4-dehydrorhamnose 3,5-epimerase
MRFEATGLDGAWLVHPQRIEDSRGYFVRTFCINEFREQGLAIDFPQHSVSHSSKKGTVRGMHFQRDPHGEVKVVRALTGAIWDVIIDIRPGSPTFKQSRGFELTSDNGLQLYIPTGFAHGFQTSRLKGSNRLQQAVISQQFRCPLDHRIRQLGLFRDVEQRIGAVGLVENP